MTIDFAAARSLGTATLHEAAGRVGALPAGIGPVETSMRFAGPAFTVQSPPGDNLFVHRGVYGAAAGDVLVVATGDDSARWGYWGEILTVAAAARGLAGVVLEGGSRDSEAIAGSGLPVFSFGACIRGTTKDASSPPGRIGTSILIGDVAVAPGDLVVGDRDGVVVISAAEAEGAIASGLEREHKERVILSALREGASTLDIYDLGG